MIYTLQTRACVLGENGAMLTNSWVGAHPFHQTCAIFLNPYVLEAARNTCIQDDTLTVVYLHTPD